MNEVFQYIRSLSVIPSPMFCTLQKLTVTRYSPLLSLLQRGMTTALVNQTSKPRVIFVLPKSPKSLSETFSSHNPNIIFHYSSAIFARSTFISNVHIQYNNTISQRERCVIDWLLKQLMTIFLSSGTSLVFDSFLAMSIFNSLYCDIPVNRFFSRACMEDNELDPLHLSLICRSIVNLMSWNCLMWPGTFSLRMFEIDSLEYPGIENLWMLQKNCQPVTFDRWLTFVCLVKRNNRVST